jgi:hypothetical protein
MSRITPLIKRSPDGYEVFLGGECIGEVRRQWFRLGGNGWTHDGLFGHPTRNDAIASLVRQYRAEIAKINAAIEEN